MTIFPDFEAQLRTLARDPSAPAAPDQERPVGHAWWRGPARAIPVVMSVLVVIAVVGAVFVLAGHRAHPGGEPPSTAATSPADRRAEMRYLDIAGQSANRLSVCQTTMPSTSDGAPSSSFGSVLSAIRASRAPVALPRSVQWDVTGVYSRHTRLALSTNGSFYWLVPVAQTGPLPTAACKAAQVNALKAELRHGPARLRVSTLGLQQRQIRFLDQINGPGVCLLIRYPDAVAGDCAIDPDKLKREGLITRQGLLAGVVPDGVTSVTVRYAPDRHQAPQTTTVRVTNNVFATQIKLAASSAAPTVTWKAGDGSTIKIITHDRGAANSSSCGGAGNAQPKRNPCS